MAILTTTTSVLVQPFTSVTVNVYEVVEVGVAVGLETVPLLSVDDGVQLYVLPLLVPFSTVLDPLQTVTSGPALTVGGGFTVTVTIAVDEHPAFVTVTVYVVVTVGFATGFAITLLLNPVPGDQL